MMPSPSWLHSPKIKELREGMLTDLDLRKSLGLTESLVLAELVRGSTMLEKLVGDRFSDDRVEQLLKDAESERKSFCDGVGRSRPV